MTTIRTFLFVGLALLLAAPVGVPAETAGVPEGFLYVPAGKFMMGTDSKEPTNESPMHEVELGPFLIAKYEVTNGEYAKFIAAKGYEKKEYWSEGGWKWLEGVSKKAKREFPDDWKDIKTALGDEFDRHPVVGVSFYEAEAYAKFAGARLPTEQEWERAARGTDERLYPWGNEFEKGLREKKPEDEKGRTHPVGANKADVSPVGAFDMGGNVSEWTGTTFCPYPGTKYVSRLWGEKARRLIKVARGGSWRFIRSVTTPVAYKCRVTYRMIQNPPENGCSFVGFRLAMNPPKAK